MRERFNDGLRVLIGLWFWLLSFPLEWLHRRRVRGFVASQAALRARYGIEDTTPIRAFESGVAEDIDRARSRLGAGAIDVFTSGSTRSRKRLLYSKARLRMVVFSFNDAFARVFPAFGVRRVSLWLVAPPADDGSLTSLLVREKRVPPWPVWLQAPYRAQVHPAVQETSERFGATATRAVMLTVTNPGVLYATNPSTLALFFGDVTREWERVRDLARACVQKRAPLAAILGRLSSAGAWVRLQRIAASSAPLPPSEWLPGMEAVICWDGGYVRPYLDRLWHVLDPRRVRHIPMYSMSTETLETIPTVVREPDGTTSIAFLPIAPGVLYEFIEEGKSDLPEHLLPPTGLEPGRNYAMVVSDAYGLRRYQTEDLFECVRRVSDLPDLRFVRRRNLSFSFTGEKLTGEQLALALQAAAEAVPEVASSGFLSCFPSAGENELPHYKLVLATRSGECPAAHLGDRLRDAVEAELCELNSEFRAKRETRRLGQLQFVTLSLEEFVRRAGGDAEARSWDGQFKVLPLYPRLWEST
ncbi:MAG: GH3 auxin-responsive promoter family protein [Myxococcaceae bacterium]